MSYARKGMYSDIYLIQIDTAPRPKWECVGCVMLHNFNELRSRFEVLLHLGSHAARGDMVPPVAVERLIREMKNEGRRRP